MIANLIDHVRRQWIAYLALFIVLGGTAVALPGKGSVTSNDIAKKAVKSKNIAKKAVKTKNLADGAVSTTKLADGAVETAKIAGGAVTAGKSSGLVEGQGEVYTRSFTVDAVGFLPDPKPVIAEVPTMGVVELLGCFGAAPYSIRTRLLSYDDAPEFYGVGTVTGSDLPSGVNPAGVVSDQTAGTFGGGGGSPLIANGGGVGTAGHWEWSLWREDGDDVQGAQVSIDGWNNAGLVGPAQCRVHATVLQND